MGRKGISRVWLAAASVFWLSACAGDYPSTQFLDSALKADPTAGFTNRVSSSQVILYWHCTRPEPGLLRVEGVAYNSWSAQAIRFLEFDLVGVVDWDRQVSATSAALPAILLWTNEVSAFRLDLKTVGTETRFDLYYQYRFNFGDRGIIAGPPGAAPQRLAQQLRRFLVRDVCSETQHRIR
jgi:hypothetical protein